MPPAWIGMTVLSEKKSVLSSVAQPEVVLAGLFGKAAAGASEVAVDWQLDSQEFEAVAVGVESSAAVPVQDILCIVAVMGHRQNR